jgi:hypothetical protein
LGRRAETIFREEVRVVVDREHAVEFTLDSLKPGIFTPRPHRRLLDGADKTGPTQQDAPE